MNESASNKSSSLKLQSLSTATEPTKFVPNSNFSSVGTPTQKLNDEQKLFNGKATFNFSFANASTAGGANPFSFNQLSAAMPQADAKGANSAQSSADCRATDNTNSATSSSTSPSSKSSIEVNSMLFTNSSKPTPIQLPVTSKQLSSMITEEAVQTSSKTEADDVAPSLAEQSLLSKKIHHRLHEPVNVVVDRSDPTSPLYSIKTFDELKIKPDLLRGITQMGFRNPSKIQEITLPLLLSEPPRNVIAQSQSGTGKTGAFSLAILTHIDPSIKHTQALVIAPTYELALQIGTVIEHMAQFLSYIRVAYAVRENHGSNKTNLVRGQLLTEAIVVGTPGTVEDWCYKRRVLDLSKLKVFCVDEADVMIDTQGFQQSCMNLVKSLNLPQCQLMLFSATYTDEVMTFAKSVVTNPVILRLKREKQSLSNISQYYIRCRGSEEKYAVIEQIYATLTVGQTMIFCRTKNMARELNIRMAGQKHSVRELTGALDIEQRASVINLFREGQFRVLISTNVTSRGIDVDDMSLVINYDMPIHTDSKPDFETYLHRIGRCGRFGKKGYAFNLISSDKDMKVMEEIQEYFHRSISELTIDQIAGLTHDGDE